MVPISSRVFFPSFSEYNFYNGESCLKEPAFPVFSHMGAVLPETETLLTPNKSLHFDKDSVNSPEIKALLDKLEVTLLKLSELLKTELNTKLETCKISDFPLIEKLRYITLVEKRTKSLNTKLIYSSKP
jgi:hypothetical protein